MYIIHRLNAKMSKSRGNVADPVEVMTREGGVGVDGLRWYLMRNGGALSSDAGMFVFRGAEEGLMDYRLFGGRVEQAVFPGGDPSREPRWADLIAKDPETVPSRCGSHHAF